MRFVYQPGGFPLSTTAFGVAFVKDELREVTPDLFSSPDAYAHAIRKLSANPCFKVVPDAMEAVAPLSEEEMTQLVENVLTTPAPKKRGRPPKLPTIIEEDH